MNFIRKMVNHKRILTQWPLGLRCLIFQNLKNMNRQNVIILGINFILSIKFEKID